jgi:Ca2+-binding EF-hand superfamily protein
LGQINRSHAMALNPTTSGQQIFRNLTQHYQNAKGELTAEGFAAVPKVFEALDADKNGQLVEGEVLKLKEIPTSIELAVELGKDIRSVTLTRADGGFEVGKKSQGQVHLEKPGVSVSAEVSPTSGGSAYYAQVGESYLRQFDNDKNGYLSAEELAGNYARLIPMWDLDEDGKVYPKEIVESYEQLRMAQDTSVRASVAYSGNAVFQSLDQNRDNRLSLREMRSAADVLKKFDKNKNGQITGDEIPLTFGVSFALGYSYVEGGQRTVRPQATSPAKTDAPEWFTRMDRNGDGDLTIKEFLGDKEQFQKLDANQDGFIEPKEAKAPAN